MHRKPLGPEGRGVIRTAIVTLAGTSSRFSASVGCECHKSLYRETPVDKSILDFQLDLLRRNRFEHVVLVGGYRFDEVQEHVQGQCSGIDITLVYNEHYADWGSCQSLCLGIDAIPGGTDTVAFLEGDLLFDETTFSEMVSSGCDAITAAPGIIDARTSVAFCISTSGHLGYFYDPSHVALHGIPPFVQLGNSGQVWQFADVSRLKDCSNRCSIPNRKGTNLIPIQDYFSGRGTSALRVFSFQTWFNCNTIADYRAMKTNMKRYQ